MEHIIMYCHLLYVEFCAFVPSFVGNLLIAY